MSLMMMMMMIVDAELTVMYRNREKTNGLKFSLGSLELFSIITFWY